MKKKNYKHRSPIKIDFMNWLSQQKTDKGDKKYTSKTIAAYGDRLSRFCNKFSPKNEEPLIYFARNIETSMMCCCFCTSLKEPDEMLNKEEIRLLANAFFYHRVAKDQSTAHPQMFNNNLFEKMVIYLCQKKLGNEYQNVIELFYKFLKSTKFDGEHSNLYKEIEERLQDLCKDDSVDWKYGYIEATRTTPAMIIGKAGQAGIPVSGLTKIFKCDYRTIKKMLKDNKIGCCHHRRRSVNISDLNAHFLKQHKGLYKKYENGVTFTSKQEEFIKDSYRALLTSVENLKKINPTLPDTKKEERKEEILKTINRLLSDYQNHVHNKKSCWSSCKEISKQTGKTNRTIQRAAKVGKIPTTRYFKKKTGYFNG